VLSALQENLITLLIYRDEQARIIRAVVDISLWGGPYRLIAARVYEYIDRYKKAPGDHVADLLADKLEVSDKHETSLYADILIAAHQAKDTINVEYVMNSLSIFIDRQSLRTIAADLNKALTKDTEQSLDEAKALIQKATKQQVSVFDPGLRLSDKKNVLKFLDIANDSFPTGIPELDRRGFGPTRKELWLGVANAKRGKSWMLIHLAKMAVIHRLKVVHISLEMSRDRTAQRYFQTFFTISKRRERFQTTRFNKNSLGRVTEFVDKSIDPRVALEDPDAREKLEKLVDKWGIRVLENIYVKDFPTGHLTVRQMEAYLDALEQNERFIPDLLIIDYPDLMKIDESNLRLSLDRIYKEIRGIAVERNIAVAIVSQAHRGSVKSKQVGSENIAEAYSKIAHADVILTYSQTEAEEKLGLARLTVVGGRNDGDKFSIALSQNYATGGFALDSVMADKAYNDLMPREGDLDED
jgi:replicative DNA helicase